MYGMLRNAADEDSGEPVVVGADGVMSIARSQKCLMTGGGKYGDTGRKELAGTHDGLDGLRLSQMLGLGQLL